MNAGIIDGDGPGRRCSYADLVVCVGLANHSHVQLLCASGADGATNEMQQS
jgi:hypothetical protein